MEENPYEPPKTPIDGTSDRVPWFSITWVELLFVLAVIAVLVAVASPVLHFPGQRNL